MNTQGAPNTIVPLDPVERHRIRARERARDPLVKERRKMRDKQKRQYYAELESRYIQLLAAYNQLLAALSNQQTSNRA